MTYIDLQDTYFSLPIAKAHCKYLSFMWRGMLYQYQCLCLRLRLAPYYFTKAMKPIFSQLRHEGIHCGHYIDDNLYCTTSKKQLERHMARSKDLLQILGFTINLEKSSHQPSTKITHLGFLIDSEAYNMSLPTE